MAGKSEHLKRYLFLILGLLVNAFGLVLITKSLLGNTPAAVIPYVLSVKFPFSYGTFTFLFNLLLLFIQIIVLGRKTKSTVFLQIPLALVYSVFIDLCVSLVAMYSPYNYSLKLGILLMGCVFRALGISLCVTADEIMLPGEAFVLALAKKLKTDFSIMKLATDIIFVASGAGLAVSLLGRMDGVREGTLIATAIIAPMSRLFTKHLMHFQERHLFSPHVLARYVRDKGKSPLIVTISSQSGSGGHKIAQILSKKLGFPLYDNNLIDLIAKQGSFDKEYVKAHMERLYTNKFWEFFVENYSYAGYSLESYEPLFEKQKEVVEHIADKGSAVIVGYCSEYLLRDDANVFSIYIHADEETKRKFLMQEYKVDSLKAVSIMKNHDRERALYFKHFTGEEWAISDRFSISIDSAMLGIEKTADLLYDIIKKTR